MEKDGKNEHVRLVLESLSVEPGKAARELHRKLRRYGDRLPLSMRYPNLPLWISIAAAVSAAARVILDAMR